jgi:hypothetical protein
MAMVVAIRVYRAPVISGSSSDLAVKQAGENVRVGLIEVQLLTEE